MKIAINTRFLLPGRLEGIGRYTYEVCRRLVEEHPEHEYLFLFDRPYDDRFVFSERVKPLSIAPPARHPFLWYAWFEWALPRVLRREQADVFFSPDGYASLRARTPTVLTIHDLAFEHYPEQVPYLVRQYYQYYTPRFCARAQRLLTVSSFTAQDIAQRYGLDAAKIAVCGNGGRAGFQPLAEAGKQQARQRYSQGLPYFLYLGAIHPRKNVHRLIAAFTRFKASSGSNAQLLIGGRMAWQSGPVEQAYEQSAAKSSIQFLGFVPDEDLPSLLGGALAFVYPSLFEGFGLPILEAMQAEVPVITSNTSSMPEVAGPAALLVEPSDEAALASAMQRMAGEPQLRSRLVALGREQRQRFSWERCTEVVYQNLLNALRNS